MTLVTSPRIDEGFVFYSNSIPYFYILRKLKVRNLKNEEVK